MKSRSQLAARGLFGGLVCSWMPVRGLHHVAIICGDYLRSRDFYTRVLGLRVVAEHFRAERNSYKLDLALPDGAQIELFSFPAPPRRWTRPEACGLRHLALLVSDLDGEIARLATLGVLSEPVRVDEYTGRRFTFIADPDGLPIELYETERRGFHHRDTEALRKHREEEENGGRETTGTDG